MTMRILIGALFFSIAVGGIFLATWNIPAPTATIEKVIPNDRFQR
jgi:hypothetical protein